MMQEYSFLREQSHRFAENHLCDNDVQIKLVGVEVDRLKPESGLTRMKWNDLNTLANDKTLVFKYPRAKVNRHWPWPFRLWNYPTVVVEGFELYTYSTLIFRAPIEGVGKHLRPGDTIRFDKASIKITL
jgi:hypothetical protein